MFREIVVAVLFAVLAVVGCSPSDIGREQRVRLPAGLPADVPLPERAVLRTVRDMGEKGQNLVFETEDTVEMVQQRLRARLPAAGWTLLSEATVESAVFTSYAKGERSLALGVSRADGVTVVGLAYHQPVLARGGG